MPGKIKVKVLAGRNLPVMDRASDTTDAFVEIKFGGVTHKTDVCRKSLNPHWNSTEWYRFEVDESELQDEPLQLRLMDHDTYSANDAIGKVVISLAPLLAREANNAKSTATPHGGAVMSGWIPVFDTMHGIRGELNVIVKVELFSDFNKYKTSSCGVQFFHCPTIPPGYKATSIHGFVEELVVNDDPEYQWIDKIRTPRASNEARQVAFIKLSNQVQRLVGLKAAELGANAVVGYQQAFDLEGEAGVVARAIGTAVSITPQPMPSHPINMPPCTQQQLKKYLDILATDNENLTDLNQYYRTHQEELQKMLTILNPNASALLDETDANDEDEKSMDLTRQSSITSYAGNVPIFQDEYYHHRNLRHLSDDQTDLNKLLNRDSDDSDSSGPLQKIKRIKTNFFSKRFSSRSKKSDRQDDSISLKSNTSDTSRLSLVDIKNEFKRLKRLKTPKFRKPVVVNKDDEGVGMASILARSVIHAHTSLACIAETQDSEHSTGRRTSESEPALNASDDDKSKINENVCKDTVEGPEIRYTSLSNINIEDTEPKRERKISESCPATPMPYRCDNLLTLPGEEGYFGSVSSALSAESSEIESSTEEDDESSDVKSDTEKSIETTSSVVQSVLSHEPDPIVVVNIERKLSDQEKPPEVIQEPETKIEVEQQVFDNQVLIDKCKSLESVPCVIENNEHKEKLIKSNGASSTSIKDEACVRKHSSHHIKFHNPFAHKKAATSISEPSSPVEKISFVHRSSQRIRRQLSKLSKSNMIKSISHYSLHPKKKDIKTPLSQPASTTDIQSKVPSDTVLGSAFLSYSDLLSLDREGHESSKHFHKSDEFDQTKFSMYIGSEPSSRASLTGSLFPKEEHHDHHRKSSTGLKPTGLLHTAMETILLDKVQNLMIPTSPDHHSSETKQFFADVNEKLGQVEKDRIQEGRKQYMEKELQPLPLLIMKAPPVNTKPIIVSTIYKKDRNSGSPNPGSSDSSPSDRHHDTTKSKLMHPLDLIHSLLVPKSSNPSSPTEKSHKKKPEVKESGLIHTAMETMLMEKVQSVLGPESPEPTHYNVFDSHHMPKTNSPKTHEELKPSGFERTAVGTMPLDKIQASGLGASVSDTVIVSDQVDKKPTQCNEELSSGLTHTAMETILLDKVQSLVGQSGMTFVEPKIFSNDSNKSSTQDLSSNPIVESSAETFILNKVTTPTFDFSVTTPVISDQDKESKSSDEIKNDAKSTSNATDTVLMNKVSSLIAQPGITYVEPKTFTDVDLETVRHINEDLKSPGLVQSAVQIILRDKAKESNSEDSNNSTNSDSKISIDPLKNHVETASDNNASIELSHLDSVQLQHTSATDIDDKVTASKNTQSEARRSPKLIRQDSIHSVTENETPKMSDKPNTSPCQVTKKPVYPTVVLETIPSMSEGSIDTVDETNISVCDNSHAVCRSNRSEKEEKSDKDKGSPRHARHESYGGKEPPPPPNAQNSSLNASSTPMGIHRRSSDSDLSVTPKGSSLTTSAGNAGSGGGAILRPSMNSNNIDMLEYPFLTMNEYPPGFIVHIGGTVCARSVKLADGGEGLARAAWWAELRTELRAHARALRCNAVLGYTDTAAICEDVCVLSASGTAAVINLDCDFNVDTDATVTVPPKNTAEEGEGEWCRVAHVPYSPGTGPYRAELSTCGGCRRARVPAVLLATIAAPQRLAAQAKAVTLTAVAGRLRRAPPTSEPGARDISDQLPFLEYELHKLLLAKLRMQGANALFSLQTQIAIGERCVMALASGSAVRLTALPAPTPPKIKGANALFSLQTQIAIGERCVMALASGSAVRLTALPAPTPPKIKASENDKDAMDIRKALWESFNANKAANGFDIGVAELASNGALPEVEGDEPLAPALDLCGDKDACVLELDEAEDVETARALAKRHVNMQVYTNTSKPAIGAPPHAFTQVWRGRLALSGGMWGGAGERHVRRALDGVAYKLRRLQPCALVAPSFHLELPEDEIQLVISGAAIPLQDPNIIDSNGNDNHHPPHHQSHHQGVGNDDDIFTLDEEQLVKASPAEVVDEKSCNGQVPTAVSLTSLSYVSGGRFTRRLCALRLLFVRETTAVRELGGLSGFLHTFTCEVMAIVRAYTAALGGNALTSFYITQLMLQDNAHKNQGQCLLSVGGDVVHIIY